MGAVLGTQTLLATIGRLISNACLYSPTERVGELAQVLVMSGGSKSERILTQSNFGSSLRVYRKPAWIVK